MIELTRGNTDTQDFYWLTACLTKNKQETRFHMIHIQIKDGYACVTDGERLHYFKTSADDIYHGQIADGYYRVLKRTKTTIQLLKVDDSDHSYPDIADFFNLNGAESNLELNGLDTNKYNNLIEHASKAAAQIIRLMETERAIDYSFVQDVLTCNDTFKVYVKADGNCVTFKSDNKTALIMPIKI